MSDITSYSNTYLEPIYAIDTKNGYAVGYRGIYNLTNGMLVKNIGLNGSNVIVYDKDGNLYFSKNGTLEKYKISALKTDTND